MNSKNGSKTFRGSLTLEWYNKEKSILLLGEKDIKSITDISAPTINWVNKDESLFYEIDEQEGKGVKPYWVDRNDIRVKEPRPLIFKKAYVAEEKNKKNGEKEFSVKELDNDDEKIQNILIKGDNLLALNTLVKMFENKPDCERVKCIYIDPPYNTGSAFENYDDNLEHSEWLTMMRDRILLLKKLLKDDGVIFVQIDQRELSYLILLMAEIFGRENLLSIITLKAKASAGVGQESFLFDVNEYIICYARDFNNVQNFDPFVTEEITDNTTNVYNKVLKNLGKERKYKTINEGIVGEIDFFEHIDFDVMSLSTRERIMDNYTKYFDKIFRTTNPQGGLMRKIMPMISKEGLYSMEYVPTKGRSKGIKYRYYFYNGALIVWLKDTATIDKASGKVMKLIRNNNLWTENLHQGIANEGLVYFPQSKKPEKLMEKIFRLSTQRNDLVLDSFAGSGTTLGVAHKMGLRWIGIEIGAHADSHIIKRLGAVLSGEDQTGISKFYDWLGGGNFKYYHLGESIISIDKDGQKDFNWNLSLNQITSGVLYYFDYRQLEDENLPKGYSIGIQTNKDRSIIGMAKINKNGSFLISEDELIEVLKYIKKAYKPIKAYLFTNCGVTCNDEEIPKDLGIVKVPQEIITSIE